MLLLLMRHGEAEMNFTSDAERELTARGREQALVQAERLAVERTTPTRVISSPFCRAVQTAGIVADKLGLPQPVTTGLLTPETAPQRAARNLEEMFVGADIGLAVLHQPLISRLILFLSGEEVPMDTANIAQLNVPDSKAGPGALFERECSELKCVY